MEDGPGSTLSTGQLPMALPLLYGANYSVYVRIARIVFAEKEVAYEQEQVDIFSDSESNSRYRMIHPFGKIPALDHDGFLLFETSAITRYIDEGFSGPCLQPADAKRRARMNQVIGIADSYLYQELVWGIYVEGVEKPARGEARDHGRFSKALSLAPRYLEVMDAFAAQAHWMAGADISLADLHLVPIFAYFLKAEQGQQLLQQRPALSAWWDRVSSRPSVKSTDPVR